MDGCWCPAPTALLCLPRGSGCSRSLQPGRQTHWGQSWGRSLEPSCPGPAWLCPGPGWQLGLCPPMPQPGQCPISPISCGLPIARLPARPRPVQSWLPGGVGPSEPPLPAALRLVLCPHWCPSPQPWLGSEPRGDAGGQAAPVSGHVSPALATGVSSSRERTDGQQGWAHSRRGQPGAVCPDMACGRPNGWGERRGLREGQQGRTVPSSQAQRPVRAAPERCCAPALR